jgi:hypothetical protein
MFMAGSSPTCNMSAQEGENFDSNILTFDNVVDAGAKTGWDCVQNIE